MNEPLKVELLGRSHAVILPDLAAREELVMAYGEARHRKGVALLRVYSAALGLCTRLGRESKADYQASRFDVLAYGGDVYGWLRAQGVSPADLTMAAIPVIVHLGEQVFPREDEVKEAAKNSKGGAEKSPAPPSPSASGTGTATSTGSTDRTTPTRSGSSPSSE